MSTKYTDWTGHSLEGRNGKYRIKSALGSGGMATVYLAVDERGREVAVKLPHEQILREEGFAARFTREIKALLKLAHPSIVKVIDVGEFQKAPFAVLQYLALGSLRLQQPLDLGDGKVWPMPPEEVIGWLNPMAEALDFVNGKGYVHRDVKPENIMFDADGNAFLGDFGVIKARAEVHHDKPQTVATGAGLVLGTPHYMAPEVLQGEAYDGRADQYSLACTVYELLAARVPFPGDIPIAILGHCTKPVPKLAALVPSTSPAIEKVVLRGLEKKKEDRFPDCRTFAEAFAKAVRAAAPKPVAVGAGGRSGPPPVPPAPRPADKLGPTPPAVPRRTAPIVCPYCAHQSTLPDHVRSKAIRCAGCRKVFLLDAVSSGGSTKMEQAKIETRPDERRVPPPPPRAPEQPRSKTPEPWYQEPSRRKSKSNIQLPPEPEHEEEPPPPPKPRKPKGPPIWQRPWFKPLMRKLSTFLLIVLLLGIGGIGIWKGIGYYESKQAKKYAEMAEKACDEGRLPDAARSADDAINKDPESPLAYSARARVRYFMGDHEGAFEDANKAIDFDPNHAPAYATRSIVQLGRGIPDDALADADKAIALNPDLAVAESYRGLAMVETGQSGNPELVCEKARMKAPENPEVHRIQAIVLKARGKPNAEAAMDLAVSKSSKSPFYLASRAIFYGVGQTSTLRFDPSSLPSLGSALPRVQSEGKEAVDKDSTCGLGYLAIAISYVRAKNYEQAVAYCKRAQGASPKMAAAYELEHWIVFNGHVPSDQNKADGLAVLDRGLKEAPTSPPLLRARGYARRMQDDLVGAIADYTELIRQTPRDPRAYELRAGCYSLKGETALETADYKMAEQVRKKPAGK